MVFHSIDTAKQFMEKAKATAGLKVSVAILAGVYETGKKWAADFIVICGWFSINTSLAGIIKPSLKPADFGKLFMTKSLAKIFFRSSVFHPEIPLIHQPIPLFGVNRIAVPFYFGNTQSYGA